MKSRPGSLHIWVFSLLVWPVILGGWVQNLQTRPTGSLSVRHPFLPLLPRPFLLLSSSPHSAIKVTMVASCLSSGQGLATHPSPCNTSAAYCRLSRAHSTKIVSFKFIFLMTWNSRQCRPILWVMKMRLGGGGISKVSRTRESVTVGKPASRAEKANLAT